MFSDNFADVGKRTTGGVGGAFAIPPPVWSGKLRPALKFAYRRVALHAAPCFGYSIFKTDEPTRYRAETERHRLNTTIFSAVISRMV